MSASVWVTLDPHIHTSKALKFHERKWQSTYTTRIAQSDMTNLAKGLAAFDVCAAKTIKFHAMASVNIIRYIILCGKRQIEREIVKRGTRFEWNSKFIKCNLNSLHSHRRTLVASLSVCVCIRVWVRFLWFQRLLFLLARSMERVAREPHAKKKRNEQKTLYSSNNFLESTTKLSVIFRLVTAKKKKTKDKME